MLPCYFSQSISCFDWYVDCRLRHVSFRSWCEIIECPDSYQCMSGNAICTLLLWWMQSVCLSFLLPPLKQRALNLRSQKCVSKHEFGVSVSECWINNHMNWLNFAFALPNCLGGVFFYLLLNQIPQSVLFPVHLPISYIFGTDVFRHNYSPLNFEKVRNFLVIAIWGNHFLYALFFSGFF